MTIHHKQELYDGKEVDSKFLLIDDKFNTPNRLISKVEMIQIAEYVADNPEKFK